MIENEKKYLKKGANGANYKMGKVFASPMNRGGQLFFHILGHTLQ